MKQMHLKGKGFSGRGVRVRDLTSDDVDENMIQATKLLSSEPTALEYQKIVWRGAVKRMVAEITEPCADLFAEDVKWRKATPEMLENLSELFTAKDVTLLQAYYRDTYEVVPSEVEDIVGKAVPVSAG